MQNIRILTAGDSSILIEFGKEISPEINRKISATIQLMKEQHIEGVVDMIPAFCSLLINYDPRVISYDEIRERMQALVKVEVKAGETCKRIFEIPVCYGGEYGPDIANIAEHAGLTEEEVIRIHSSKDYLIYMLGFCRALPIWGDWMNGSIPQDLPIREYGSVQAVWESEVLRQVFIHWILREAGSLWA